MEPDLDNPRDDARSEKFGRWIKPLTWLAVVVIIAAGYLLLYPVLIIFLESKNIFNDPSSLTFQIIEISILPLIWLNDNVGLCKGYFEWLDGWID